MRLGQQVVAEYQPLRYCPYYRQLSAEKLFLMCSDTYLMHTYSRTHRYYNTESIVHWGEMVWAQN